MWEDSYLWSICWWGRVVHLPDWQPCNLLHVPKGNPQLRITSHNGVGVRGPSSYETLYEVRDQRHPERPKAPRRHVKNFGTLNFEEDSKRMLHEYLNSREELFLSLPLKQNEAKCEKRKT